jgi:hypothetical protein
MAPRRSFNARIDEKLAQLRERGESGIATGPESDFRAYAKAALTIADDDEPLKKLFDATRLDPNNPAHWAALVGVLAKLRFGSRKKGRRQRWTTDELSQFVHEYYKLDQTHTKWSAGRICKKLVADNERYAKLSDQTLRRRFQDALNDDNIALVKDSFSDDDVKEWLERRRRSGRGLKGLVSVREIMLGETIEMILSGLHKLERKQGNNFRSKKMIERISEHLFRSKPPN